MMFGVISKISEILLKNFRKLFIFRIKFPEAFINYLIQMKGSKSILNWISK